MRARLIVELIPAHSLLHLLLLHSIFSRSPSACLAGEALLTHSGACAVMFIHGPCVLPGASDAVHYQGGGHMAGAGRHDEAWQWVPGTTPCVLGRVLPGPEVVLHRPGAVCGAHLWGRALGAQHQPSRCPVTSRDVSTCLQDGVSSP
jgi:hypothetical protein